MSSGISLTRFVNAQVSHAPGSIAQRSFGTAGFACWHDAWAPRSREFASDSEVLTALKVGGYSVTDALKHPAYLGAVALCAQEQRPSSFKILRRAGKPTQRMRFTPDTPLETEVYSLTIRGVTFSVTAPATPTAAGIVDLLVALMSADDDAIVASGVASTTGVQSLDSSHWNGVLGDDDAFAVPRNLTLTLNAHADWDATTIVAEGRDPVGRVQSENFNVPNGGGTTLVGTKLWGAPPTLVTIPAQSGTNGTLKIGVGTRWDKAGEILFTVTDGADHIDIVNTNAGDWYGYSAVSENLAIEDRSVDDADTPLTDDLDEIEDADADFYALVVLDGESDAMIKDAAAWAESHVVTYFAQTIDTLIETSDFDGTHADLKELGYERTLPCHTRVNHESRFVCGLIGAQFGKPVGSRSYLYLEVKGQQVDTFSLEVLNRICGPKGAPQNGTRGLIYIAMKATGTNVGAPRTVGGFTSGGIWAHQIAGIDAACADMQAAFISARSDPNNDRPYNEQGAMADEGDVLSVLQKYSRPPFNVFEESTIKTSHKPMAEISDATRKTGDYDGPSFVVKTKDPIATAMIRGSVI